LVPLFLACGWWPSIDARTVLVNAYDGKGPSWSGLFQNLAASFADKNNILRYKDGVGATLTVHQNGRSLGLQSNGLSQSGRSLDPPHHNLESSMVGLFPAIHRP